tara:strand:+ start:536 stop:655 length:120 start_codon:yes stop_codon:yes gene_type:complete
MPPRLPGECGPGGRTLSTGDGEEDIVDFMAMSDDDEGYM